MTDVAGEFLERLPALGRIPFGHGELPAFGMVHLHLACLPLLSRYAKGPYEQREQTTEQKIRLDF
jgi:hypothetical protein